tara:strand:- start:401 stop:511 length:111 start_codon:yes stop_codon:yes gene_type:complete
MILREKSAFPILALHKMFVEKKEFGDKIFFEKMDKC